MFNEYILDLAGAKNNIYTLKDYFININIKI